MYYLTHPVSGHIDTMNRFNFNLLMAVRDMFNWTFVLSRTTSWGYVKNGRFDGMIGALIRNETDIGGAPIFYWLERHKWIDVAGRSWSSRPCFIFRHPRSTQKDRIVFLQPFTNDVWVLIMGCGIITVLILWLLTTIEWKLVPHDGSALIKPKGSPTTAASSSAAGGTGSAPHNCNLGGSNWGESTWRGWNRTHRCWNSLATLLSKTQQVPEGSQSQAESTAGTSWPLPGIGSLFRGNHMPAGTGFFHRFCLGSLYCDHQLALLLLHLSILFSQYCGYSIDGEAEDHQDSEWLGAQFAEGGNGGYTLQQGLFFGNWTTKE